ncbi:MAG: phasin family protein [Steroidobacteraceae bacterium]
MNSNPFSPFGSANPANFDLTKLLDAAKVPGVDVQALLSAQSKNIEALAKANSMAIEGMQAVAKRQMEIMTQTMAETSKVASSLNMTADPREKAQLLTNLTKQAFEQALENMRVLADMVSQSNRNALDVISKRVSDGLDEVRDLAKK